jgi:DNA-binding GntR family transcriptional regulator
VVTQLTAAQVEGVYAVRAELEGLACELFARNASQAQEAELEGAFAALKKAMGKGDPIERLEAKNAFYECLMRGSGNEALGDTLRMLNSRVTLLRATSLQAAGRSAKSIAELEDVLAALRARRQEGPRRRRATRPIPGSSSSSVAWRRSLISSAGAPG